MIPSSASATAIRTDARDDRCDAHRVENVQLAV